jgi:hypothetical protein
MVAGSAGGIHSLNQVAPACADWRTSSRVRPGSGPRSGPPATMSNAPGLARWAPRWSPRWRRPAGGEGLFAVGGAARGGRRVQDSAVPAGGPAQRAGVGESTADPDRDPRLLHRPGQADDLADLEVRALVGERLPGPQPGQHLQRLIDHRGPCAQAGWLAERGRRESGELTLLPWCPPMMPRLALGHLRCRNLGGPRRSLSGRLRHNVVHD